MAGPIKGKQLANDTVTATQADTTNGVISTVNGGDSAVEGTGTGLARRDHQHAVATGTPTGTVEIADVGAEGTSTDLARADHVHPVGTPGAPVDVTKSAAATGTSVIPARADHKHDVATATPVEISDSTNTEGTSTSLARADHVHAHGDRGGGTLHSVATVSVNGFMSAADKTKLDSLVDPDTFDAKEKVRLLTDDTNITLSGNQTIDGILTAPGDRVGVFGQTTTTEDGIYVTAAGAWTRADDFTAASDQSTAIIPVDQGSANADSLFMVVNNEGSATVGTDDLTVTKFAAGTPRGAGAGLVLNGNDLDAVANGDGSIVVNPNDIQVGVITDPQHGDQPLGDGLFHAIATTLIAGFMSAADKTKLDGITAGGEPNDTDRQEEVTTQAITGTDTTLTDTLDNTPIDNASVSLYLNGVHQCQGAGRDYTISGTSITWLAATGTAVDLEVSDVLEAKYKS